MQCPVGVQKRETSIGVDDFGPGPRQLAKFLIAGEPAEYRGSGRHRGIGTDGPEAFTADDALADCFSAIVAKSAMRGAPTRRATSASSTAAFHARRKLTQPRGSCPADDARYPVLQNGLRQETPGSRVQSQLLGCRKGEFRRPGALQVQEGRRSKSPHSPLQRRRQPPHLECERSVDDHRTSTWRHSLSPSDIIRCCAP